MQHGCGEVQLANCPSFIRDEPDGSRSRTATAVYGAFLTWVQEGQEVSWHGAINGHPQSMVKGMGSSSLSSTAHSPD